MFARFINRCPYDKVHEVVTIIGVVVGAILWLSLIYNIVMFYYFITPDTNIWLIFTGWIVFAISWLIVQVCGYFNKINDKRKDA